MSKTLPIAVQVYSVREEAERDFAGTMKKLGEMGYDGVELAGLYGKSAEEIRDSIKAAGLTAISAHVSYDELAGDLEKTLQDYETIGCRYIVIPWLGEDRRFGAALYEETIKGIPVISEGCKKHGMTLLYHNHDFEFAKTPDGTYALDQLYGCGSKVLYQSARSETVNLLTDTVTGETNYWFRSWSDSTGRGGRRSALYDKDGSEVLAFDGEQSATIQNGLLVLQESRMVGDSYDVDYDSYGTCSVIDLATGKNLPVPEGAYSCIVCGDMLVFTCYARPADLAENEWDDDSNLHSWVAIQQKDGTQTYGSASSTAYRISYASNELDNWVELDISHADGSPADQVLHNPATGEGLRGYRQTCGHGTAAFLTPSGTYQLRDMTTEDRGVIAEFDALPSNYFPGYVVTWNVDSDYRYSLHDLSTGEVTPLYAVSLAGNRIALYAQDGSLKVYDTDTGALLTDVNAGTIGDDQRVTLDCEEDGFVWMELRDADSYEIAAIRVYGPEGLVSDLSSLNETYNYLGYLTTDANGRPLYYGTRSVPGSSYATGCDVLDETGNVVMQGLGSCYSYYDNSLNALPDHVFVARRGFYYGWMDTDGNWLYCQSIFSSVNADDELGY